jgi:phage shock protein PspC (stress-responsive transcriptional regulator)
MNKTVNINISGLIFNIEEAAYDQLKAYLEKLKHHLKNVESGDEIYADIEIRIAELFQEKLTEFKQVIDLLDLESVIAQIGLPEDYIDSDDAYTDDEAEFVESEDVDDDGNSEANTKKRFYRDTQHAWLGGVCAGIAVYLNISVVLVRIAMIILLANFGSGFIIYLILWFVIPEATSTADFLKMHGKPVNFKNIKKEFKDFKEDFSSKGKKKGENRGRSRNSQRKGQKFKRFIGKFFRVVARVGGSLMILSSVMWISTILFGLYTEISFIDGDGPNFGMSIYEFSSLLTKDASHQLWAWIGLNLMVFTPLLILLIAGCQLVILKSLKAMKFVYLFLIAVFIAGVGISIGSGIKFGSELTFEGQSEDLIELTGVDTLNINLLENDIFSNELDHRDLFFPAFLNVGEEKISFASPELILATSADSIFRVSITRYAHGPSQKRSEDLAERIDYEFNADSNNIDLATMYQINKEDRIRIQDVKVTIEVPEGKSVKLDRKIERLLNVRRSSFLSNYVESYNNQVLTASQSGFDCENCMETPNKRKSRRITISTKKFDGFMNVIKEEVVELEID